MRVREYGTNARRDSCCKCLVCWGRVLASCTGIAGIDEDLHIRRGLVLTMLVSLVAMGMIKHKRRANIDCLHSAAQLAPVHILWCVDMALPIP